MYLIWLLKTEAKRSGPIPILPPQFSGQLVVRIIFGKHDICLFFLDYGDVNKLATDCHSRRLIGVKCLQPRLSNKNI